MARYAHADVLDNGPARIQSAANKVVLVSAYTVGDTFATVHTTNKVAEATIASTDFTLAGADAADRTCTFGGKSGTATATGGGVNNHFAFVDTVNSKVLWVTPETSGQSVTLSNPVTFPSLVYTAKQPVAPV